MKNIMLFVVLSVGFIAVGCDDQGDDTRASSGHESGYLSSLSRGGDSDYGSTHDRLHRVDDHSDDSGLLGLLNIIGPALIGPALLLAFVVFVVWFAYSQCVKPLIEWFEEQRGVIDETHWNTKVAKREHARTLARLIEGRVVDLLSSGHIDLFNRSFGKKGLELTDVDLSNLDLTGVSAHYVNAWSVSVAGSKLEKATMYCSWKNVDAKNASFRGSKISGSFSACDFEGCDFTGADLTDASFEFSCRLVGVKLDDVKMDDQELGDLITEVVRQQAQERKAKAAG